MGGGEGDGGVVAFEFGEDGFGAVDDTQGEAGEAGDLDAVAAVGGAGDDAADEGGRLDSSSGLEGGSELGGEDGVAWQLLVAAGGLGFEAGEPGVGFGGAAEGG